MYKILTLALLISINAPAMAGISKKGNTSTALSAPQHYDLTGVITPGRHIITISVDNRIKKINPGINSHSISDHTQGNWNGMIGDLYIEAKPSVHWGVVSIFPDFHHDSLTVKANVRNDEDRRQTVAFEFNIGTMATKGIKRTVNTGDTPDRKSVV